jgi:cell division protein FtsL
MAREDTQWFIVAVVILSLVLFLALPMSLLVLVETEKMKSDIRKETRELRKLKEEVKEMIK